MKRISRIELENSRVYFNRLSISLGKGENLLLYGENGSGKTSLYKGLNDFIQSFYKPTNYTPNRYKARGEYGEVKLCVGDYDTNTQEFSNNINYSFSEGSDNTNVQNTGYLKALAQTKGFLNYRDLLRMYLYEDVNPNLFDFFVEHLLKNHVPIAQGGRLTLLDEWNKTKDDIKNVNNRKARKHRRGKDELVDFEIRLRAVLDTLFLEVNRYLSSYFPNFILDINYDLKPMRFSYGNKRGKANWTITHDLRLVVNSGRAPIKFYNEGLNEARLSAIAICIYLAALKANSGSELKLMFLDDIFIGIDSSNRTPILKILNQEFSDFQIVIATYDRSWYLLAKKFLNNINPNLWKCVSLYTKPKHDHGIEFVEPVLIQSDSLFDRGKQYLHGDRVFDLPAAANYFRKTIEELLSEDHLPHELFIKNDYSHIPGYKLTDHVAAVSKLFDKIGMDKRYINVIDSYLSPLIHPLSHYEDDIPVYRNELIEVEDAINGLIGQIASFPHKCRLFVGKGDELCIQYNKLDGSYISNFFVHLEENLWLYKDTVGNPKFTDCKCRLVYVEDEENGIKLPPFTPSNNTHHKYDSLDEALQKIYDHVANTKNHNVVQNVDYNIVYFCDKRKVKKCIKLKRDSLLAQM